MERGTELSKTVATFIIQKILHDEQGLNYLCQTAHRFFAVSTVLENMVKVHAENNSSRLLKHIIRCYARLSENKCALTALKQNPPSIVQLVIGVEKLDDATRKCLSNFKENLEKSEEVGQDNQ